MRHTLVRAACAGALFLALAGCGSGRGDDGLTSEEREKLNQYAAELDGADVIDASPDSLVANDSAVAEPGTAPAGAAANITNSSNGQ
jgi:hypothetical protein